MAKKGTQQVKATLDEFLFNQILNSPKYHAWEQNFEFPSVISDNISKPLRDYQINAIKHFIYVFENFGMEHARHLLFNMATGTGKTLTMAGIILYLYEFGYRNFIFLVHQVQIKDQAVKNFTDYKFDKYLFNPKGIKIGGKNIRIHAIERFEDAKKDGINFLFFSTQLLYKRITEPKENAITAEHFKNNLTVIIADEAHHLNVDTRKKLTKTDEQDVQNWETSVQSVLHANPKNLLLEFTATVDLKNANIHQKYKDKLIYRYDFLQFNKDGFSKNVAFLYNEETHIKDQKRLLIINAVALSEYRRLFALTEMNMKFTPIVLIKSIKIAQSEEDRAFFHQVISSLHRDDFEHLKEMSKHKQDLFDEQHRFIEQMFDWIGKNLINQGDKDGLQTFINHIKESFSEHQTFVYNSKEKSNADKLLNLDTERNTIRAIFSVNALNEGWDVLGLFDIIHFDISSSKKVSLQDIQLIGRGARLKPYQLPRKYREIKNELFESGIKDTTYQRKFDKAIEHKGRILETFFYHFVKTGVFLNELIAELKDNGIINQGVEKRTIHLKPSFMQSHTYKNGFVLVNEQQFRPKTTDDDINNAFNREIKAHSYRLHQRGLTNIEQNKHQANIKSKTIYLKEPHFSREIIRKALSCAENGFFRFNNITQHIADLKSLDVLIDEYLPKYQIIYSYEHGKDINELKPNEKLQLLIGAILPEVRKLIDKYIAIMVGSSIFKPKPLQSIFKQEKNIYLMAYPKSSQENTDNQNSHEVIDERGKAQTGHHNSELNLDIGCRDWYAYNENYGTSEEKRFVKFIDSQIDELKHKYPNAEIYLIRNELDYYLFSPKDGRRFSPDYMMIINDVVNKQMYYQCLFEPKGGHLIAHDDWKEQVLIDLHQESQISFNHHSHDDYQTYLDEIKQNNYQEIKCLGFKFFNSEYEKLAEFRQDFQDKLL